MNEAFAASRSTSPGPAPFVRTCQALHAVFHQLESILPPGTEGLGAVRRLQAELELAPPPAWERLENAVPRSKSA
ncbi:MAG TPA: hypothetical protein VJ483_10020 [Holophagaceae bacterium]|nr:hypothetical protein [Holophagaceae bacterium]